MSVNSEIQNNEQLEEQSNHMDWKSKIEKSIKEFPIMIYMRGSPEAPQCGFSARVMRIMTNLKKKHGVDFGTEDMDSDPELWDTLKKLNKWPTSPQIYVNGEFIGGCDIFVEMAKSGELEKMLQPLEKN